MKETRVALKDHFKKGDTPTQQHFENLIDSLLNQEDDGVSKSPNDPLSIKAIGTDEGLINFYPVTGGTTPTWQLKQKPGGKAGLSIHDAAAAGTPSRLFIEGGTGNVGIGTTSPGANLNIKGGNDPTLKIQSEGTNEISGRLSLRQSNDTGADVYYDGRDAVDGLTVELFQAGGQSKGIPLFISNKGNTVGNVGIGTTTPAAKLDVTGNTRLGRDIADSWFPFTNGWTYVSGKGIIFRDDKAGGYAERMRISDGGNVGIGTTAPGAKLEVIGVVRGAKSASEYTEISHGGSHGYVNTVGDGNLDFRHDGNTKMSITSDGNVGIGTTDPKIHLAIGDNDTGLQQKGDGELAIYTNNQERVRVNKAGNVGIGTTTPVAKLDIKQATRSGSHPTTVKGLYVTGNFGDASGGVEFRHSNATSGIGFGYNSIYATGTNANQHLNLLPRGTGGVGIGTKAPGEKLEVNGTVKAKSFKIGNTTFTANDLAVLKKLAAGTLIISLQDQRNKKFLDSGGGGTGTPYLHGSNLNNTYQQWKVYVR